MGREKEVKGCMGVDQITFRYTDSGGSLVNMQRKRHEKKDRKRKQQAHSVCNLL